MSHPNLLDSEVGELMSCHHNEHQIRPNYTEIREKLRTLSLKVKTVIHQITNNPLT